MIGKLAALSAMIAISASAAQARGFHQVKAREPCVVLGSRDAGREDGGAGRTMMGGIAGAAIGSRFGDGKGKKAMTVLGGIAGATAGSRTGRRLVRYDVMIDNGGRFQVISVTQPEDGARLRQKTGCFIETDGRDARIVPRRTEGR